jgi:hypothetical protein
MRPLGTGTRAGFGGSEVFCFSMDRSHESRPRRGRKTMDGGCASCRDMRRSGVFYPSGGADLLWRGDEQSDRRRSGSVRPGDRGGSNGSAIGVRKGLRGGVAMFAACRDNLATADVYCLRRATDNGRGIGDQLLCLPMRLHRRFPPQPPRVRKDGSRPNRQSGRGRTSRLLPTRVANAGRRAPPPVC